MNEYIKVLILDEADGFEVRVIADDIPVARVRIDQEDTRESLVPIFELLGFQTEYEESY